MRPTGRRTARMLPHSWQGEADAPVLVLSNSLGTVQSMWKECMPGLAERFRVLTYDLPGHFGPSDPFTFDDMVRETIALLDELEISQTMIAGVSVGGAIAVAAGAARPDIVSGVVSVNAPIRQTSSQFWHERAVGVKRDGLSPLAEGLWGRWFAERTPAAQRIVDDFAAMDADGYAEACRALADLDITESASRLTLPTLIVSALDDVSVPHANALELGTRIADSVVWPVQDGGHLLPVRRPEIVAPLVRTFAESRGV